jgi:hypothetical protein
MPTIRPTPHTPGSVPRPDPGALETRRPAALVKRSLLDEDEDRRTLTATGTTDPLTQRGANMREPSGLSLWHHAHQPDTTEAGIPCQATSSRGLLSNPC